jgi:hypothetical protein
MSSPSRRWLWFFAVLAVLGIVAMVVPVVYNLRLQLRPEQLAEARQRWREHAPADYTLEVLTNTTTPDGGEERDEYAVVVRGGQVRAVGANRKLVHEKELVYADPALAVLLGPGILALPPEDLRRYGVEALFDQLEEALRHNEAAGGRNYLTAQFDPIDGHPLHCVRRIRGTKERVEWFVRLIRPSGDREPQG